MWFNILKIEGRRAAYRFFINSMIHQGELILPKPPTEVVNEGGVRLLIAETRNGHFEWEQEYNFDGTLGKFYLASAPSDIEPYIDYMEGMFEQEYPQQYAALQDFFKENVPPTEEREEDGFFSPKKRLIRKIMHDWAAYMDNINSFVLNGLENIEINIPVARYRRLLGADIDADISYKEVRDYIHAGPGLGTKNLPLATIRAIQATYAKTLQRKNPDIVWENFINFVAHFREEYMQHIAFMARDRDNFSLAREEVVHDILRGTMEDLARNIWRNNPNDVETLMNQLPNYN